MSDNCERSALAARMLMQMMDCDETQVRKWENDFDRKWLVAIGFIAKHVPAPAQAVGEPVAWQVLGSRGDWQHIPTNLLENYRSAGNEVRPLYASQPSPAATVETARVPKVRTSHHRNKEEAARLQALADERYANSSAGNGGDPTAGGQWNDGCDFAMTQLCIFLGVDQNDVRWDAATETVDGDVQAVIGNILRAKFGEDWGPDVTPTEPQGAQVPRGYERRCLDKKGQPATLWYPSRDEPTPENMAFDGVYAYEYRPLYAGPSVSRPELGGGK